MEEEKKYEANRLVGSCFNGFERDGGSRWHIRDKRTYKALCSTKPGPKSNGWGSYPKPVSEADCPRCLKSFKAKAKMGKL